MAAAVFFIPTVLLFLTVAGAIGDLIEYFTR